MLSARQAVVLFASWLSHILIVGFYWGASGPLFAAMRGHIPSDSGSLAVVFTFSNAMMYIVGPISSLLTNRFDHRVVTMLGGTIGGAGVILSTFATSVYHLHITFGFMTGLGLGIAYLPNVSIVALHFKNTRTIAMGFAVSGCGVGTFAFPPLIRLFIRHYGWRGALLLSGAILLNICVCGALLKPIGRRRRPEVVVRKDSADVNKNINVELGAATEAETGTGEDIPAQGQGQGQGQGQDYELGQGQSQGQGQDQGQGRGQGQGLGQGQGQGQGRSRDVIKTSLAKWIQEFNFHVFASKSFGILCLNNLCLMFGLSIVYVHLAAYAYSLGFTEDQGAYLFSALGIANFFGRIAFGLVAHVPGISALSLYTVAFFVTGAATELTAYFTTYAALVGYAVTFGFLSASLGTLLPQLLVEFLGVDLLTSGYGYVLIFEAVGTLMGAPVAGWVYDSTDVYQTSLYLGGAAIMLSSLLMTYPWFCNRTHAPLVVADMQDVEADA